MKLTIIDWKNGLKSSAKILKENNEMLSELDSVTGDGDHGVTIHKIAEVIETAVEKWENDILLKNFFDDLGWKIMGVSGGSAGPLWGTIFTGLADGLEDEQEVDKDILKKIFSSSMDALKGISNAKVGDKTMMDAFIPAVEEIKNSNKNMQEMLKDAAKVAKEGAENTVNFIAKFGRAKNLKEKSLGHKDPGAVSISLFFEGFVKGIEKNS
ncbi:dihydroxyacetone kinase subunit DhaL [Crassaminicella profunda]|uniref:dihydroxyacetone kinase subunit DhaL n=1 Tax=Crassaminicella profunda TaxID=1286698 RepID=UPI001CA77A22|nr:dihydroxyacetone kinase subunit DhaL [Crassaminicella profunda]QZY54414.1 dihydroxyacetone kinase subunit L [Crassaminicella profunda]